MGTLLILDQYSVAEPPGFSETILWKTGIMVRGWGWRKREGDRKRGRGRRGRGRSWEMEWRKGGGGEEVGGGFLLKMLSCAPGSPASSPPWHTGWGTTVFAIRVLLRSGRTDQLHP